MNITGKFLIIVTTSFYLYSAQDLQVCTPKGTEYKLIETMSYEQILETLNSRNNNKFTSIAWNEQSKLLATGYEDGSIIIWDIYNKDQISKFADHKQCITGLSWSLDGRTLASSSLDGSIGIYDSYNKVVKLQSVSGCQSRLYSVALSPDAKFVAVGASNTAIEIWDIKKKSPIKVLCAHDGTIYSLAWSPNGKFLASGSYNGGIQIWDLEKGHSFKELIKGHQSLVSSLYWSDNGDKIISGSYDKTIKVWDTISYQEINSLQNNSKVIGVTYFDNENEIVSCSKNSTIKIWQKVK
ncbi:MAG: WD40 repeat domain-containing protein [Candidatus Babeliales bacterium]|nr:WD40 repeat domain-containing protein [Candidatus Babeliales bacterium]